MLGAAGRWAGPAQLVRRVGCAPGRILPRCTPAPAPLCAYAGTLGRTTLAPPGQEHVARTGDPRWQREAPCFLQMFHQQVLETGNRWH